MKKKELAALIDVSFRRLGRELTIVLLDELKAIGYRYATAAGVSIAIDDMQIPASKKDVVDAALKTVDDVEGQYAEGLITKGEKYNKVIDIWAQATEQVAGALLAELQQEEQPDLREGARRAAGAPRA